jgi:hypothetical protein
MGTIRPLFFDIPPKRFDLPRDWQRHFVDLSLQVIRLDAEAFKHIEAWLRCYVDMFHIASYSADSSMVIQALQRLQRRSKKLQIGHSAAREQSLRTELQYQVPPRDETERAQNIALDYVGNALLCDRQDYASEDRPQRGCRAKIVLKSIAIDEESVTRLERHCGNAIDLLSRTHDENAAHFAKFHGRSLPLGKTFELKADSNMAKHFRIEQDAIDVLAAAMCVIYRYIGGHASVSNDGRSNDPFMQFLDAACKALPQPKPGSLHSPARTLLRAERQNGDGTLQTIMDRVCPSTASEA